MYIRILVFNLNSSPCDGNFSITRAMSMKLFSACDKYCRALANDLLTPLGQKSYTSLFVREYL